MVHFIFGPITPSPSFFIKKLFHSHYLNKAQVSYIFRTYNPVPRDHFYSCRNTIKKKGTRHEEQKNIYIASYGNISFSREY